MLGIAAMLRFWSLGFGIPYAVGVDEPEIMERVVNMMKTGDFNPHFFDYPTAFLLHAAARRDRAVPVRRASAGRGHSLDQVSAADFYLWARALTAAIGTATVFLLFQIGLRWGARHALLGAGLLAVLPMHVRESHFVLTDVPATFFATLTLAAVARRAREGDAASVHVGGRRRRPDHRHQIQRRRRPDHAAHRGRR